MLNACKGIKMNCPAHQAKLQQKKSFIKVKKLNIRKVHKMWV